MFINSSSDDNPVATRFETFTTVDIDSNVYIEICPLFLNDINVSLFILDGFILISSSLRTYFMP